VNFTETNLFGVYVAPISLMLVAAWIVTIALRRVAARFGLLRYVWHPALFGFAIYLIVLSSIVLLAGAKGGQPKVDIRKSEKL
jgi:protein AaeX